MLNFSNYVFIFLWAGRICTTSKEHFKEKLLNKTVSSSKILHNFSFYINWVIRARNGLPPPVPTTQFGCVTAAFPIIADTTVFLAVTAGDGAIFHLFPFILYSVLCLQFPFCCMIISSTPLCLTVTISSFSLSFPSSCSSSPECTFIPLPFYHKPMGPGVFKLLSCLLWLLWSPGTCPCNIEGTNGHHTLREAEVHKHRN